MKLPHVLLLPALLALAACKAPGPELWSRDGVRVLLTETRALDEHYAEYRVEVTDGRARYCFGSGALGSPSERRASFSAVQALDGYLFVPASCGGGNASKCRGFEAFATQPRLTWLGYITGKGDGPGVVPYESGTFYDTGDMLEINDLLNHAESPRYAMAYGEAAGRLIFDVERTWTLNLARFRAADDDPPGLLFRAGLAKLCGKPAALRAVLARADRVLDAGSRARLRGSLQRVPTGNLQPNLFIPVGECPADAKP